MDSNKLRVTSHGIFFLLAVLPLACLLSSCATAPKFQQQCPIVSVPPVVRGDAVHVVAPGETIWRIGKMYDVPMEAIARANNLSDTTKLEKGQRLRIPGAAPLRPVITTYPSTKWKYIVIHHSASDEGNSFTFDKWHRSKGWDGVGYHFVIDNGTDNKQDGQLETSPRWIKQQDGSHCKAASMNTKGIGICLVGNFNKTCVSRKQLDSLVALVSQLRQYYHIPYENIIGHKQAPGASTECPGKNFPWTEFRARLRSER